jgi:hypothetical protein
MTVQTVDKRLDDWLTGFRAILGMACDHYQLTAPTVRDHCDDLYRRVEADPAKVTLAEIFGVHALWADDWMQANHAANHVYKLRSRLGMDTTGQAGF